MICVYTCTCMHSCMYGSEWQCVLVNDSGCTYVRTYVCSVYVHIYIHTHTFIYRYRYRHRHSYRYTYTYVGRSQLITTDRIDNNKSKRIQWSKNTCTVHVFKFYIPPSWTLAESFIRGLLTLGLVQGFSRRCVRRFL